VLSKYYNQSAKLFFIIMEFQQPVLKFKNDDLLPFISLRTIEYHYGKHHLTYINNLNNLIKDNEYANASLEEIVRKSDGALFNNAAQVYNHNFYFDQFTNAKTEPTAKFIDLLSANELTLDTLKEKMISAAIALFGSG
jgi:Fe-Mn family superoxide dismutase